MNMTAFQIAADLLSVDPNILMKSLLNRSVTAGTSKVEVPLKLSEVLSIILTLIANPLILLWWHTSLPRIRRSSSTSLEATIPCTSACREHGIQIGDFKYLSFTNRQTTLVMHWPRPCMNNCSFGLSERSMLCYRTMSKGLSSSASLISLDLSLSTKIASNNSGLLFKHCMLSESTPLLSV